MQPHLVDDLYTWTSLTPEPPLLAKMKKEKKKKKIKVYTCQGEWYLTWRVNFMHTHSRVMEILSQLYVIGFSKFSYPVNQNIFEKTGIWVQNFTICIHNLWAVQVFCHFFNASICNQNIEWNTCNESNKINMKIAGMHFFP